MILASLKDQGGKAGKSKRCYQNFSNQVNQTDVACFIASAEPRLESVS